MSEMDRGAFTKGGYTVEPADGGSFVVVRGGAEWAKKGFLPEWRGFSDWRDLLEWLRTEHEVNANAILSSGEKQAAPDI